MIVLRVSAASFEISHTKLLYLSIDSKIETRFNILEEGPEI